MFILGVLTFGLAVGAEYGEQCDDEDPNFLCNPYADLICNSNRRCECLKPNEMEYDEEISRCVVKIGFNCNNTDNANFECTGPSFCHPTTRKCKCIIPNSPTADGHWAKSHGAACDNSIESQRCNPIDGLECVFGSCRCAHPIQEGWNNQNYKCYTKLGARCAIVPGPNDVPCNTDQAWCDSGIDSLTRGTCQCLPGSHIGHFFRTCFLDHGARCTDSDDIVFSPGCDAREGLIGDKGYYKCKNKPDAIWDADQNMCAIMEHNPCTSYKDTSHVNLDDWTAPCYSGTKCEMLGNNVYSGICKNITIN